jgi:hypothetical protein
MKINNRKKMYNKYFFQFYFPGNGVLSLIRFGAFEIKIMVYVQKQWRYHHYGWFGDIDLRIPYWWEVPYGWKPRWYEYLGGLGHLISVFEWSFLRFSWVGKKLNFRERDLFYKREEKYYRKLKNKE